MNMLIVIIIIIIIAPQQRNRDDGPDAQQEEGIPEAGAAGPRLGEHLQMRLADFASSSFCPFCGPGSTSFRKMGAVRFAQNINKRVLNERAHKIW